MVWELPRTSKCLAAVVVVICSLITIAFLLPLDDHFLSTFSPAALFLNATFSKSRRPTLTLLAESVVTDTLKRMESDMTTLTSFSSSKSMPLLVLDRVLMMCIYDSKMCQLSQLQNQTRFVFGIFQENVTVVKQMVQRLRKSDNWTTNDYVKHYLFKNSNFEFILALIEKRPNYWYVDGLKALKLNAFAILPPKELRVYSFLNNRDTLLPWPVNETIVQLNRSRFLSCKSDVAKRLRQKYPRFYANQTISDSFVKYLAYMRDLLLKLDMVPFLFGGTLLGWYRECGLIPDTTDLDLCALASDYKPALEETLKNDTTLRLYWILGKPSDSLEYSVYARNVKIDLFFLYQTEKDSWVGGMIVYKKRKLRWTYPKLTDLCTADLKDHLFNVPCNVEGFLTADYGPMWYEPHRDSRFVWYKSHKNVKEVGNWSLREWPSVYRPFGPV